MNGCIFAGTFDPITVGHMDIIRRAARQFGRVYLAFLVNPKKTTMFPLARRLAFAREAVDGMPEVEIVSHDGLLVDLCRKIGVNTVVRGVRNGSDFEYEILQANVNMHLNRDIEVVFFPTRSEFLHISSSMVRELIKSGGDASEFLPFYLAKEENV